MTRQDIERELREEATNAGYPIRTYILARFGAGVSLARAIEKRLISKSATWENLVLELVAVAKAALPLIDDCLQNAEGVVADCFRMQAKAARDAIARANEFRPSPVQAMNVLGNALIDKVRKI